MLNDGIGNPKNTKSLLLAHQTPPAMSMGVRDTAETAVRAGIQHILFTVQPEEVAASMDAYLKALKPVPSPLPRQWPAIRFSPPRRETLQRSPRGLRHVPPARLVHRFEDLQRRHAGRIDKPTDRFDTPTLVEGWRTAPYLHDGR